MFLNNKKSLLLKDVIGLCWGANGPNDIKCMTLLGGIEASYITVFDSGCGSLSCAKLRGLSFLFVAAHEYGPSRGCRF
jgi:hypothetical protein